MFLMSGIGLSTALTASRLTGGFAHAEALPRSPLVRPNAEQWDMTSKITGRTYRIYVAKPVAAQEAPPSEGYPVIYLTDGDFNFNTAADAVMMQSIGREAKPAYVVGIGYGKDWQTASRTRCADLTPFPPDAATLASLEASPLTKGASYGEAAGFHRFLTEELRPQIDATYSTNRRDNVLWGHSFGGLFALYVLFNHPDAYQTYLINSPSINWGNGAILKQEAKLKDALAAGKAAPRVLLIAGEYEEKLADHVKLYPGVTREQMQAMLTSFGMVTNALALADRLKAMKAPAGFQVEAVIFPSETHLSVVPTAISRGLRFALPLE
ncbi:alpha/beta hydrolase [Steroidobacter flavus]|uniref:Alpha/beta hydrolase n=1 Tax=Steroidobacter flavus TaxID=1842136 RepID=A0ABV8SWK8_9GAMM